MIKDPRTYKLSHLKFSFLPLLISYVESYCIENKEDKTNWSNPLDVNCDHVDKKRMESEIKNCFEFGTPRDMFGHITSDDIGIDSRDEVS